MSLCHVFNVFYYFLDVFYVHECCCALVCQDVEIKQQAHSFSYAFVQFDNITSVVNALREMDGEQIGLNKIKVSDETLPLPLGWITSSAEAFSPSRPNAQPRHNQKVR